MESYSQAAKKRSKEFTSHEEPVMIELVKKFKNYIENKKPDTNSNQIKAQSWNELAKEFDTTCGHSYRIPTILSNNYENMKKRTSEEFVDGKSYRFKTGAPPNKSPDMNEFNIAGITSDKADRQDSSPQLKDSPSLNALKDWSKYTLNMLRQPKSQQLQHCSPDDEEPTPKRAKNQLDKKLRNREESRVKLAELQKKCYLEEHSLKLRLLALEHNEKIRLMQKENDAKIQKILQGSVIDSSDK